MILILGGVYLAVEILRQAAKFALALLQAWLSESAISFTRLHLWKKRGEERTGEGEGRDIVSVLTAEVEALGGFAGSGPSQALVNATMLLGGVGYMMWIQPHVALLGLALLAPLMQKRLNRMVSIQVRLKRRFVAASGDSPPPGQEDMRIRIMHIFRMRLVFAIWKTLLKSGLNLLNSAAPIAVLVIGGLMVVAGQTTVGVIVAFVGGFGRLAAPVRELIAFYRAWAEAKVRHRMIAAWMARD